MKDKKYSRIPRYYGLRIYLISTLMFFFLVFPVAGILLFKYVPDYLQLNHNKEANVNGIPIQNMADTVMTMTSMSIQDTMASQGGLKIRIATPVSDSASNQRQGIIIDNNQGRSQIGGTLSLLIRLLLVSFIMGFAFNLPYKIYFRRKRKNIPISFRLHKFCKKYLLRTPLINSAILLLSYVIVIVYMIYILAFRKDIDTLNRQFYLQYFFITLVATVLTLLLVYFWLRHRVHIRYLEHIYSEEELRHSIFKLNRGKIRNRLWISGAMTTLLPLIIVIFYLVLSISSVRELQMTEIKEDYLKILLGRYISLNLGLDLDSLNSLFYVNAVNSLLMVIGIGTGIFIAMIYIILFVNWTTEDIVRPVRELLANMQRAGEGELDSTSIVRTDDEIGELTQGYNEMSDRLRNYFTSLKNINQANARFVPQQFLDFLGKDNITDIQLGDQVQKEMTILFSDIRDFTSISERMTPKENFDFINNYLGYMEPVIRNNNGFIDKFMGDSIMALFPEKSEDAINAAIEMRIKLTEFNEIISQFGKPTINSGIGIHTGMLMLGIIGGEGRMDGTVISDAVNLSSRIEGLNKIYGTSVIITEDTLIRVTDPSHYHFRFLDIVKVKGKKEAVYIFEIIDGDPDHLKQAKIQTKDDYGRAIQAYKKRDFQEAIRHFESIREINPEDRVTSLYLERCHRYIQSGLPDQWDGTESIDYKF